ncbi:uncharacterized protein LOC143274683 [Babylonia areolata]|uniref:uncharacterized protein LOC143274683 n=1 Tax=Babylonia areolata TaxID=304850 RepID=UPI003FD638E9
MELAGTIQDEFLTCNICFEAYTRPKQLPCLHTFCLDCLSRYITQTVGHSGVLSVPCPICRRPCKPPDPDPRKLNQWADQFPDNFFVASLRETLETRIAVQGEDKPGEATDSPSDSKQTVRYFMGEVQTCSTHPAHRLTHYCLSAKGGVCELCLAEAPHSDCGEDTHLDADQAQNSATDLLNRYRQEMGQVQQEAEDVKQVFNRKPRQLQVRKEETEISVRDYFSVLRSSCARFLLSKEKEVIEALSNVIEEECQRTSAAQGTCDQLMTSMDNTVSLLDTLMYRGPFKAMNVLVRVEEQIANISRLITKMNQESKTDSVRFCPPSQSLEDLLSGYSMGEIVADFGSGDTAVSDFSEGGLGTTAVDDGSSATSTRGQTEDHDSAPDAQASAPDGPLGNLENQMSELTLTSASPAADLVERLGDRNMCTSAPCPTAPPLDESAPPPYEDVSRSNSDRSVASCGVPTVPGCRSSPAESGVASAAWVNRYSSGSSYSSTPTVPPSGTIPSPYSDATGDHYTFQPSAPPLSELPPPAADWAGRSGSPALKEAFQRSIHKDFSCSPLMVFSGNMPKEHRTGGICGAAMVGEVNRAAFVDRYNHSVKIVDLRFAQVIGFLHLGDLEPWDITFMAARMELAVTCPGTRCLVFVPTQSRSLEIAYHIYSSVGYCCIAHLKDDLFSGGVCAPFGQPAVHVFNLKGAVLREIQPGYFSYPRTIFADSSGSYIVVSDWMSNVVILVTSEGELVCRYRDAPAPKGVAFSDLTGLMYVLDGKWSRLHLLDTTGQCLGTGKVEGCQDPRMVVQVPVSLINQFPDVEVTVIANGKNALHVMRVSTETTL